MSTSTLRDTLRDLTPGCRDSDGCLSCKRWDAAAGAVARAQIPPGAVREYTRDEWLEVLEAAVAEAVASGFEPHQARATADKAEDGSEQPAADDERLMEALTEAQRELDRHAAASLARDVVEPHPSFTSDVIWPGGVIPPAGSVRQTPTDVAQWEDAAFAVLCQTLVEDMATGCLERGEPKATVPIFATALRSKPRMESPGFNTASITAALACAPLCG